MSGKPTRRNLIRTIGTTGMVGSLAGCTGSDGGGSGGQDTTEKQTPQQSTEVQGNQATDQQGYESSLGVVSFDMAAIPPEVAMREEMSASSSGRFTGTLDQFSNATLILQSLIAGDVDFYLSSPGLPYQAQAAGNDLRILMTTFAGTDYVIALQNNVDSLKAFENSDLSFGVSSPGGVDHLQSVGVFSEEGIDTDAVNFVKIGGSSSRTKALAAGDLDGSAIHIGQFKRLKAQGLPVKNYGRIQEWFPNFIQECIVASSRFLEDDTREQFAQQYITNVVKAHKRAHEDFEWVYNKTQKYQAKSLERADAKEVWKLNKDTLSAWPYEEFTASGYESTLSVMTEAGTIDGDELDLDTMFEPKYFKRAREQI